MDARLGSLLIGFAVVVGAGFALFEFGDAARPVGRGTPAPAFSLPRVDGSGRVSLDELRGKVVLVNFWATWCKPCEDEMPAMERLYRRLAGQGFELVAISVDEDADAVRRFRERYGLTFTILLDPEKRTARDYQTFRFPESLLIGADGVVVERYVGEKRWDAEAYVERIRRLLAARLPSGSA